MDKVNDGVSKFNIGDNQFVEHENTFNLMYNTCGLYRGGLGEEDPQKLVLKILNFWPQHVLLPHHTAHSNQPPHMATCLS